MRGKLLGALTAIAAVLAFAATAQARTWTVYAGAYSGPGFKPALLKSIGAKGVGAVQANGIEVDTFSVPKLDVHVGDKVKWIIEGGHTVTFNKKGAGDIPLVEPDPAAAKVQGVNDAAGMPFWFNGQTRLDFPPTAVLPMGTKIETGSSVVSSGLFTGNGNPPPFALTFNKVGTYKYECTVHPGMDGAIKVLPKRKKVPSPAAVQRRELALVTTEAKTAVGLLAHTPPADTVSAGDDSAHIAFLQFFPATLHVPVGTTVTFSETSKVEVHTFSFGTPTYLNSVASQLIEPIPNPSGPPTLEFNPQVAFPSEPPSTTTPTYTGTNHGNGFLNSGLVDANPGSNAPTSFRVTFSKAGSYNFQCLIHPFMKGTIVVGS